ncbi:ABC transporter ATP-binding protein [uncultured Maritalea sp.]|jgi:branched-chain amino acid transport system ATP-binding protein|uniref:ABC transporter ATP-binding protein n=1 Tax=uncultured Maritalea sp. TaxID=757249 RepID=UPI002627EEFD|nr:ABC transporter ATP-binding protein [uncultured Maritalea sp.]
MSDLLTIENIEVFYGPSQALFGVDLKMGEGEVVALMGRNGMGKTTTIRTLCRMSKQKAGRIQFAGQDIGNLPSHKVAQLGVGLVPEGRRCFANLTVEENLLAAARGTEWTLARVYELFPRLEERQTQLANTLSGGEQQMLAIGRALMTNPKLLVLDEATEGLAPVIREEIWRAVRELKATGQSILIVDKTLAELLPIADHCVILERGRTAWAGTPDALTPELADRYLGV